MNLFRRKAAPLEASAMMATLMPGRIRRPPDRGTAGMLMAYNRSPWVRALTAKISSAVGEVDWRLYAARTVGTERGWRRVPRVQKSGVTHQAFRRKMVDIPEGVELVEVTDHIALDALNESGALPGNVQRTLTQAYIELTGEAFWLLDGKLDGGRFVPTSFYVIPPTWVQDVPMTPDGMFIFNHGGVTFNVPAQMVLWFVNPNPADPYGRGSGHMRALGDEIDTDEYAAKYVRSWFFNSARPDLIIYGKDLSKDATKRLESQWISKMSGYLRQHLPFFVNASLEIKELSHKFSDMQMIEMRKFERDLLINARGAPPEIFGIVENSNRATISASDFLFNSNLVVPALELQRAYLQASLIPMYDDRLILGYESPVSEDQDFQLKVATAAPWSLDVSEWRALGGQVAKDEYDGIHVFKLTEKPQLMEIKEPLPPPGPAPALPEPPPEEEPPALPPGDTEDRAVSALTPAVSFRDVMDAARGTIVVDRVEPTNGGTRGVRWGQTIEALEGILLGSAAAASWLEKQIGGPDLLDMATQLSDQMLSDVQAAWSTLRGEVDMAAFTAALETGNANAAMAVLDALEFDAAFDAAKQTLREAIIMVGGVAATDLLEAIGLEIEFELFSPTVLEELEAYGAEMVTNVSQASKDAMRAILVDGYSEGRTASEIARQVRDHIGLTEPQARQAMKLYGEWVEAFGADVADSKLADWALAKIQKRSQVISVNELLQAGNRAQDMTWEEASRQGLIDPGTVEREWILSHDPCEQCQQMAGVKVKLNQKWPTPNGDFKTVSEIHVSCRCSQRLVFV